MDIELEACDWLMLRRWYNAADGSVGKRWIICKRSLVAR